MYSQAACSAFDRFLEPKITVVSARLSPSRPSRSSASAVSRFTARRSVGGTRAPSRTRYASANLPALVMLLFWRGTTKQGITWAIVVGLTSSLAWVLMSKDAFVKVYHLPNAEALVPWSQPGIVTIPLGFAVLIAVSLLTRRRPVA